jgi:hypothetical protein
VCGLCNITFISVFELRSHQCAKATQPYPYLDEQQLKLFVDGAAENIAKVLMDSLRFAHQETNYLAVSSERFPQLADLPRDKLVLSIKKRVLAKMRKRIPNSECYWEKSANIVIIKLAKKTPAEPKQHIKINPSKAQPTKGKK